MAAFSKAIVLLTLWVGTKSAAAPVPTFSLQRVGIETFAEHPVLAEGQPVSRVLTRTFPGARRAWLENVRYDVRARIGAIIVGEALRWGGGKALAFPPVTASPERALETRLVEGALVVSVFPEERDRVLRAADVVVETGETELDEEPPASGIILTTERLAPMAERLRRFHRDRYGVASAVVTVETIARTARPVDESTLPDGYKQIVGSERARRLVANYDYELARKIIAHLRGRLAGVRYVTVLGSARLVPPSYYFASRPGAGADYGVTDQCYGALGRCDDPRAAVGRLPFDVPAELDAFLAKVERRLSVTPVSELAAFAGVAFDVELYVAELAALGPFGLGGWRGATKYFHSLGAFDRGTVLDFVRGRRAHGLAFYVDHGKGNQWFVNDDDVFVSSRDIVDNDGEISAVPSIVATIACATGAFDEALTREEVLGPARFGEHAIGVTLLKARSGAVAFLGPSRDAIGNPVYQVDRSGNIDVIGTTYGLQLLDAFIEKYAAGEGRLGDAVLAGQRTYAFERGNDFSNARHRWSYLNLALLGDPAMRLPPRAVREPLGAVARSTTVFDEARPPRFPTWFADSGRELTLQLTANGPVRAQLLRIERNGFVTAAHAVDERRLPAGETRLAVPSVPGRYFLRVENETGVRTERQIWFHVVPRR